ncbi:ABC transporter ATP-binding protein [Xanthobacter autotrophicus]|uniref:ABC transporter ATP-binding protein n=1 Tax=Xanthobacter autotrophicus TaxID=280 RepID=UPI00372BA56F
MTAPLSSAPLASAPALAARHPALDIRNVSKTFLVQGRPIEALAGITLTVEAGAFVSVVGASGCGKSTLLRLILGLDRDYSGEIRLDDRPVDGPGADRAIVFQEHRLLPWLTVEANVGAALLHSGLDKPARRRAVAEHLELVGLEAFANAYPAQLSGGMAQRVAIARALANRPRFLLLDEPLGALDALTRLRLQEELKRIVTHEGATAILVTHDVDEAVYLGHRIVVLHPRPGRIAAVLNVPEVARRDRSSPQFVALRDQVLELLGVVHAPAERGVGAGAETAA